VTSPATDEISRRVWLVVIIAGVATMLPSVNLSIMYVVYPEIEKAFPSVGKGSLSWVLNAYTVVSSATLVLGGVLADRTGRKRAQLIGVLGFLVGSVMCATAPGVAWIVAGRTIMGLASSVLITATTAIALRDVPPSKRATAFGVTSSFGGVGAAAGPAIGSAIISAGGWRWAFWINVPIALVILVLGQIIFRESREETDEPFPDPFGAALLLIGVSLGILALVQSPTWNWLDVRTVACLALAAFVLTTLVTRSLHHARPVIDFSLFRYRNFALLTSGAFVLGVAWFGTYFVLVQFLRNQWHYGLLEAGLLVSPIPFGAGVLAPLCGRVADRTGYRVLVMSGGAAFTLASAWMLLMVGDEPNVARWMPGVILMAIGTGISFPAVQGGPVVDMAPDQYAVAMGFNQTVQRVGSAIGNAIAIVFVASAGYVGGFHRMFSVMLVGAMMLFVLGASLRYRTVGGFAHARAGA
jgi:EmrB/QacA subfamily drug resistance transporter